MSAPSAAGTLIHMQLNYEILASKSLQVGPMYFVLELGHMLQLVI